MPVAKTYLTWPIQGEPFTSSGKQYVVVINPKGVEKTVRWYSQKEWNRMYPELAGSQIDEVSSQLKFRTQREILGFGEDGTITIFKGNTADYIPWFKASVARYNKNWGWYIVSSDEVPTELPFGIEAIKLGWSNVGDASGKLYPDERVQAYCDSLRFEEGVSRFQGQIGDRLELTATVEKAIPLENDYGHSTLFIFSDECENQYCWMTNSSKSWEVGATLHIRGTVKAHKTYQNTQQTWLNRVAETKK